MSVESSLLNLTAFHNGRAYPCARLGLEEFGRFSESPSILQGDTALTLALMASMYGLPEVEMAKLLNENAQAFLAPFVAACKASAPGR